MPDYKLDNGKLCGKVPIDKVLALAIGDLNEYSQLERKEKA